MNAFSSRLRERSAEALEWVDYRRDAGFWPFLLVPPLLSVAWAYGGTIGLGIVLAFGMVVAALALVASLSVFGLWIIGMATSDAARLLVHATITLGKAGSRHPATIR